MNLLFQAVHKGSDFLVDYQSALQFPIAEKSETKPSACLPSFESIAIIPFFPRFTVDSFLDGPMGSATTSVKHPGNLQGRVSFIHRETPLPSLLKVGQVLQIFTSTILNSAGEYEHARLEGAHA
jgi:hypothetical protein